MRNWQWINNYEKIKLSFTDAYKCDAILHDINLITRIEYYNYQNWIQQLPEFNTTITRIKYYNYQNLIQSTGGR